MKIRASLNSAPSPRSGTARVARRTLPGENVRVVRFNVKPDERESFERFFWESLRPAAAKRAGVPVDDVDLGGFRLLIPSKPNPQGYFTYYVLVDPAGGALGAGQVMRDMVREAFPGDEGQERVRRWMESMVLAAPFAPVGEDFVEADLRTQRPPNQGRDQADAGPQKDARIAVEGVLDAWLQAFERGEADVLARLFVEDGMYAANTGQLLRGRAAIENGVRGWIAIRPKFFARVGLDENSELEVDREVLRFRLLGNGAYSVFRFMIRVKPAGCLMDVGHALAVWRQGDGEWRIESLAVNQDREPPKDACARR